MFLESDKVRCRRKLSEDEHSLTVAAPGITGSERGNETSEHWLGTLFPEVFLALLAWRFLDWLGGAAGFIHG